MKKTVNKPTAEQVADFDITGTICSMHTVHKYPELYKGRDQWPMYSFDRPAYTLWNAVGEELFRNGWTMDEIRSLLQSKHPRWALDGKLGEQIIALGKAWGKEMLNEHEQVQQWVEEEKKDKSG